MRQVWIAVSALISITAAPSAAVAQDVGLKGGLPFGASDAGLLPGDIGGRSGVMLLLSVSSPGRVAVGLDVLYSQRFVVGEAASASPARDLEYLELPFLVRAATEAGSVLPFVAAGPQISREIDCDAGPTTCQRERPKWLTAAVAGGGIVFGADPAASLELRFVYGFEDLNVRPGIDERDRHDRSFMVLGGLIF